MYTKNCDYCGCEFQTTNKIKRFCKNIHGIYWGRRNRSSFNHIRYLSREEAKKRNIQFEITSQDLKDIYEKQNGVCKYTGRKLSFGINKDEQISIDRTNSSLPYTKDNVDLVCLNVQFAKHEMTPKQFVQMCHDVANNFKD